MSELAVQCLHSASVSVSTCGLTELCCLSMHEESVLIPVPQDKATGENRHAEETPAVQYMHVFIHLPNI